MAERYLDISRTFSGLMDQHFLSTIYGHNIIKEVLFLQLIAPEPINILLIGDPSTGKTAILKEIAQLKEAKYYEGSAATIITKDVSQFLCFNKIDQASPRDKHILIELMSAGISVLAAAGPKFGRFDPYGIISEQIDLAPSLLTKFDLIFPLKDLPSREIDEEVAFFILEERKSVGKLFLPKMTPTIPQMTIEAIEELKQYYVNTRNISGKSVPIRPRQLVTLAKLAKAAANARQSRKVNKEDAEQSLRIMDYCLNQIAKDKETGLIDIDRLIRK